MKIAFEHKPDFRLRDFVIEKAVTVPAEVFADMLKHPLKNQPFIIENVPLMCQDGNGVYHCLLVTGEGRTDGILVESDGYGYAKYASYVPEAAALQYPSLSKWNRELADAVDFIVTSGLNHTTDGTCRMTFDEIEAQTSLCLEENAFLQEILYEMICERPEIVDLDIDCDDYAHDYLEITYHSEYCPNIQNEGTSVTQKLKI